DIAGKQRCAAPALGVHAGDDRALGECPSRATVALDALERSDQIRFYERQWQQIPGAGLHRKAHDGRAVGVPHHDQRRSAVGRARGERLELRMRGLAQMQDQGLWKRTDIMQRVDVSVDGELALQTQARKLAQNRLEMVESLLAP